MDDAVTKLKARLAEISDLANAAALLEWDQQTYMPPGGAAARAEQTATLHKLAHETLMSDDTAQVRAVFEQLKRGLVPLVRAMAEKPETDDAMLRQDFDEHTQWQFGEMVIRRFGFDFNRGRQDRAPHPFCTSFGAGDVRLTTRVAARYLPTALMGTLHEAGHGLYEQGFAPELARTPLAAATSLGIHESQSRMWENLVGRSSGFWKFFYPQLQAAFPEALAGTSPDTFYRAVNKVRPSLIRIEADEVTYNLHTLLRFEMEVDLLDGRLPAAGAPEAWNAKVKEYLGVGRRHRRCLRPVSHTACGTARTAACSPGRLTTSPI